MNFVWPALFISGIAYALIKGDGGSVLTYLTQSAAEAVALLASLAGIYALWCGVLEIFDRCGAMGALSRLLAPVVRRLFPSTERDGQARKHISANLAANMLGMGNAATPEGIEAMKCLARHSGGEMSADMGMFIILNCSSVQLIPSTMISMRAAAGSAAAADIILPSLITTAFTTALGLAAGYAYLRLRARFGGAAR